MRFLEYLEVRLKIRKEELWYWLCTFETLGPVAVNALLGFYGSPEALWEAKLPEGRLVLEKNDRQTSVSARQIKEVSESRRDPERYAAELEALKGQQIRFVGRNDELFPPRLLELPDCPPGIFTKGRLPDPERRSVAIVGARCCDEYGRQLAAHFAGELAALGVNIISGMAVGIDGEGQRAALSRGGYSLAVLGCGVDVCYPMTNYNLYMDLARQGGLVSEFLPGAKPMSYRFPQRNRLISAFADAVLVVEAREESGSLITADQALEQGRDVMAVPGRLGDPLSEGCNRLIRQGAAIITCVEDILEVIGMCVPQDEEFVADDNETDNISSEENTDACGGSCDAFVVRSAAGSSSLNSSVRGSTAGRSILPDDPVDKQIVGLLSVQPTHIDILAEGTGLSVSDVLLRLLRLEMNGFVRQVSQGQYVRMIFSDEAGRTL